MCNFFKYCAHAFKCDEANYSNYRNNLYAVEIDNDVCLLDNLPSVDHDAWIEFCSQIKVSQM